jgi:hypothetical protein
MCGITGHSSRKLLYLNSSSLQPLASILLSSTFVTSTSINSVVSNLPLRYGAEPILRNCQLCSYSGTSQHFKEPEGSSPCLQELSTGHYPEPHRSSPYHPILSLLRSILILSIYLRLGLPSGLFPSGFPTNIYIYIAECT